VVSGSRGTTGEISSLGSGGVIERVVVVVGGGEMARVARERCRFPRRGLAGGRNEGEGGARDMMDGERQG
jgi:hypothetical protein